MEKTPNYNLKKPGNDDFYNVQDFNDNADIIDQALKAHDDALATKETPQGAQEKADAALASAKAYTDQQISAITPEQIGAETPTGAQAKANTAEANAKAYTDQEVTKIANNLASHKNDNTPHREAVSIERKNPDDDGIFKLIEFRRSDGTLFKTSQLNGTSPYNSRTVKYYDKNENLIQTVEYSITYLNDEVVSEVIISA